MAFTEDEAAYLKSQPLARIATVGSDGQPDVTPVSFEFDGTYFYIGDWAPERTRRFRNVKAGNAKVSLVVDDLVSVDPWTPRFLRVYGTAAWMARRTRAYPR
jgi:pyridoxamine 5'-phosphate oxidase family protein